MLFREEGRQTVYDQSQAYARKLTCFPYRDGDAENLPFYILLIFLMYSVDALKCGLAS